MIQYILLGILALWLITAFVLAWMMTDYKVSYTERTPRNFLLGLVGGIIWPIYFLSGLTFKLTERAGDYIESSMD